MNVYVPLPLSTTVPLEAVTLFIFKILPSTSELEPNNCALVKVIAVSSTAANVTGTAIGASLTADTLIVAELATLTVPSLTLKLKPAGPL